MLSNDPFDRSGYWIPAFAGMTPWDWIVGTNHNPAYIRLSRNSMKRSGLL